MNVSATNADPRILQQAQAENGAALQVLKNQMQNDPLREGLLNMIQQDPASQASAQIAAGQRLDVKA
jgi:hypothetical protein